MSTVVLTCNPQDGERSSRLLTGRALIMRKEHSSYKVILMVEILRQLCTIYYDFSIFSTPQFFRSQNWPYKLLLTGQLFTKLCLLTRRCKFSFQPSPRIFSSKVLKRLNVFLQPFDVLIKSTELLFRTVEIPSHLLPAVNVLNSLSTIAPDGKKCSQFLLWAAEVAQV